MRFKEILEVIFQLGLKNVLANLIFKLRKKLGLFSRTANQPEIFQDNFFSEKNIINRNPKSSKILYIPFSWIDGIKIDDINWSKNYLTNNICDYGNKPWFDIDDFSQSSGDIKGVWEASRFNWAPQLATSYLDNNDDSLKVLNKAIFSWCKNNKPFYGYNWKCGQECSIRILNLALSSIILNQHNKMNNELKIFVSNHLERINETTFYAKSQQNNHVLSEAAALYVGGSWLELNGFKERHHYKNKGERMLEKYITELIDEDGTFSQYSTNYHRFVLDIVAFSELWRQKLDQNLFSKRFYQKAENLISWLYQLTDKNTGGVPNLGSNDGALFFDLSNDSYRDFRYTLQRSSIIFRKENIYPLSEISDRSIEILDTEKLKSSTLEQSSFHFKKGGLIGMRENKNDLFVLLNYPNFKFRPSQCDSLHIDFWHKGQNLLRDGGTFSYNSTNEKNNYYSGNKSHNNVEFDDVNEMPKISRFLFSSWSKIIKANLDINKKEAYVEHKTRKGCFHSRSVKINENKLIINDCVKNFNKKAVIRWRLIGKNWKICDNSISNGKLTILITSKIPNLSIKLVRGYESLFYFKEEELTVIEIEINNGGEIKTELKV